MLPCACQALNNPNRQGWWLSHLQQTNSCPEGRGISFKLFFVLQLVFPRKIEHQLTSSNCFSGILGFRPRDRSHWNRLKMLSYFVLMHREPRYGPGSDEYRFWDTRSPTKLQVCSKIAGMKLCSVIPQCHSVHRFELASQTPIANAKHMWQLAKLGYTSNTN